MFGLNFLALLLIEPTTTVTPHSPPSVYAWNTSVQDKLGKAMRYPKRYGRSDYGHDSVEILFTLDVSGRPTGARVARTSNNGFTDAAALAAIERLGSLHPLPATIGKSPSLRAILTFPRSDAKTTGELAILRLQDAP